MKQERVILDAAIERSVIRGMLASASGERRDFHGCLELNTALETILGFAVPITQPSAIVQDERSTEIGDG
jgi:hypothetical protein